MRNLTKIHRIRFSERELSIKNLCKEKGIKFSDFIREAIREKAERELNYVIEIPF